MDQHELGVKHSEDILGVGSLNRWDNLGKVLFTLSSLGFNDCYKKG